MTEFLSDLDEDYETFFRELTGVFADHPDWIYPEDEFYTYEQAVQGAANTAAQEIDGMDVDELEGEFIGMTGRPPITNEFRFEHRNSPQRIYFTTPHEAPETDFIMGGVFHTGLDAYYPEMDSTRHPAEHGRDSLQYKLWKTHTRLAEQHATAYVLVDDEENAAYSDSVASILVPPHYHREILERTADALSETSHQIDRLHHKLMKTIEEYGTG